MKNQSVKIEAIKSDNSGYKLIAFSFVTYFPRCKPQVSHCKLADFKNGVLRFFEGNSHRSVEFTTPDFTRALQYIRELI